jgi:hypothetical protein
MTDSDQDHRAVRKNGHDQLQDRDLRDLRDAIDRQRAADLEAHGDILKKLDSLDRDVLVTHARDEERNKAELRLRRQVAALAMLLMTVAIGLVSWGASQSHDLHQDVAENTKHFVEFQAIGIRWGDDIDARAKAIQDDARQLRKIVNEHQRNSKRHSK